MLHNLRIAIFSVITHPECEFHTKLISYQNRLYRIVSLSLYKVMEDINKTHVEDVNLGGSVESWAWNVSESYLCHAGRRFARYPVLTGWLHIQFHVLLNTKCGVE